MNMPSALGADLGGALKPPPPPPRYHPPQLALMTLLLRSSGSRHQTARCKSTPEAKGYICSSSKACSGHGTSTSPGSICRADAWRSTGCYAYRQETETNSPQTTAIARYAHCLQCQHWQCSPQLKLCLKTPGDYTQITALADMLACWSQSQHWQQWVGPTSFSGVPCLINRNIAMHLLITIPSNGRHECSHKGTTKVLHDTA